MLVNVPGVAHVSKATVQVVQPYDATYPLVDITSFCTHVHLDVKRSAATTLNLTLNDPKGFMSPNGQYTDLLRPRGSIQGLTTTTVVADPQYVNPVYTVAPPAQPPYTANINGIVLNSEVMLDGTGNAAVSPLTGNELRIYTVVSNPGDVHKYVQVTLYNGNTPFKQVKFLIEDYNWDRNSENAHHKLSCQDLSKRLNIGNIVMPSFRGQAASAIAATILKNAANLNLRWTVPDYHVRVLHLSGMSPMQALQRLMGVRVASWRMDADDYFEVYDHLAQGSPVRTFSYIDNVNLYTIGVQEQDTDVINVVRVTRGGPDEGLIGTADGQITFTATAAKPGDPSPLPTNGVLQLPNVTLQMGNTSLETTTTGDLPVIPLSSVDVSFQYPSPAMFRYKIDLIRNCWLLYILGKLSNGDWVTVYSNPYKPSPWTSMPQIFPPQPIPVVGDKGAVSLQNPFVGAKLVFQNITTYGAPNNSAPTTGFSSNYQFQPAPQSQIASNIPPVVVPLYGNYKIRFFGVSLEEFLAGVTTPFNPVVQTVTDPASIKVYGLRPAKEDIVDPLIPDDVTAQQMGQRWLLEHGRYQERVTDEIPFNPDLRVGDIVEITDSVYNYPQTQFYLESFSQELSEKDEQTRIDEVRYVIQ